MNKLELYDLTVKAKENYKLTKRKYFYREYKKLYKKYKKAGGKLKI